MNIKLHNKFEITLNGKTIVAYNTLLKGVYSKIAKLEQYTSHIALGKGQVQLDQDAKKLTLYDRSFAAETEEYNYDETKGTLFIKKLVNVDESSPDTFSFSELGICASSDFDPEIYNHVLLTDSDGNVVSVTRRAGDSLQIRVTIYLELNGSGHGLFIKGNNKLIGRILGDNFSVSDNNLYAVKGTNLSKNEPISRITPNLDEAAVCTGSSAVTKEGATVTFFAELGEGATEEIVFVYDNSACLRYNVQEINSPLSLSESFTSTSDNVIELGRDVKEVSSVTSSGEADTNYTLVNFSKKLSDKITSPFDQTFNASTKRFVSPDGKMIAFISAGLVHLYKNENYTFTKLNTTQMPASNLFDMFIFDDRVMVLYTTSPYIRIFDIVDDSLVERTVNLTQYNASAYSYDWKMASAVKSNNVIILGLIVNNETSTPVILRFTKSGSNAYFDNLTRPSIVSANQVYAINKNPYTESFVAFVTENGDNYYTYMIEEFYESTSKYGKSSSIALNLIYNGKSLTSAGRAVIAEKSVYPYLVIYYHPNYDFAGNDVESGEKVFVSKDGNYIILKMGDGDYKIKTLYRVGVYEELPGGFPSFVNLNEALDFEFTFDTLLVFTSSLVYAITMPKQFSRLDNVKNSESSYTIGYKKYDLLGSLPLEGVRADFKLTFKTTSNINRIKVAAPLSRMNIESFESLGDVKV